MPKNELANRTGDFEIHVGFSRVDLGLTKRLPRTLKWVAGYVHEVVTPAHGRGMYEGHDVPGPLGLIATTRLPSLGAALAGVDAIGRSLAGESHVRIEVEEVLLTHLGSEPPEFRSTPDCSVQEGDLAHVDLILDSPPFEIHFGLYQDHSDHPFGIGTQEVVDLLGDHIDEAVRFSSKKKITTTTFFATLAEMQRSCQPLSKLVCEALVELPLSLKVVAERIVLCAAPKH